MGPARSIPAGSRMEVGQPSFEVRFQVLFGLFCGSKFTGFNSL
ncbi:hypothetical protein SynBIOSU31_01246 [Synechococcus sp. BIOS-U3-1]|nr:hypothetical protein SynBIOSU31_01246 [Synechococcus sp. BIOS-U3-1]